MAKFKVGDKVIAKNGAPYVITTNGWTGKVVGTLENPNGHEIWCGDIKVENEEDGPFSVESKYFDLANESQKIVITTDGLKTTTAKLYEGKQVIKTAVAKCSPDDEFDFNVGAKIAFDRLFETVTKSLIDWEAFESGKLWVKCTRENIDRFLKICESREYQWYNNSATEFNPYEAYGSLSPMAKGIANIFGASINEDIPVYITLSDGSLSWNNKTIDGRKVYEFI